MGLRAGLTRDVAALSRLRELRPFFASSFGVLAVMLGEYVGPREGLLFADIAGVVGFRRIAVVPLGLGVEWPASVCGTAASGRWRSSREARRNGVRAGLR